MSIVDAVSCICLLAGSLFCVVGGIGLLRLPDFFSRLHGAGITDTMGAGLVMAGLMLQAIKVGIVPLIGGGGFVAGPWLVTVKLLMILFFLLITSPTACHALAQAALTHGVRPQLAEDEDGAAE